MSKNRPATAGAFLRGWVIAAALLLLPCFANEPLNSLALPSAGDRSVTVIDQTLLEYSLVTTKDPDPAPVDGWNYVGANFELSLPELSSFDVRVNGQPFAVSALGFKRRPLYAPVKSRDLRILSTVYLRLAAPVPEGAAVTVNGTETIADPLRRNPAIHVNQVGYLPAMSKKAMVGYYLGSLGELQVSADRFHILDSKTREPVFSGHLVRRRDIGWSYEPKPYQQVLDADFTELRTAGEYVLQVPGMGVSWPFRIDDGTAAAFARSLALGLYHQRCGTVNSLPVTRFEHGICHAAPAEVPTLEFTAVNRELAAMSSNYRDNPLHTAPQLKDVDSSLYPFIQRGPIDVSGGHHDAGDYSKYTINSAALIHHLIFAADSLRGVAELDNLGLPESGDGIPDVLQEAKWEADFLVKMQDADGGFYFLVYPRDREYENDVLPDHGDPQVVFPKTTAATAAAAGALAEAASSPVLKKHFPETAARYLESARKGWAFLQAAMAKFGRNGSYQKITHYGNEFIHDDELAWAAAALFAATGEPQYHDALRTGYDPSDPNTRRWTWWRLFEGYGCAARAYAFAARSGRLREEQLDRAYRLKCENEIIAAGDDIARFAEQTAYGTSFPDPNKQFRTAGWYFSSERAFEMAVAYQLAPKQRYLDAILSNMNYEGGCNPVNVTYITGLGWKRWRDIVHQYAQNDSRVLPPAGLPLGNIQGGFAWLDNYKQELGSLCFPPDGAEVDPYPFYDRWGDSFNTTTEFVVVDQARALATLAFLMAQTPAADSDGRNSTGKIVGLPLSAPAGESVTITLEGLSPDARIVWEARDQEPFIGPAFSFAPKNPGEQWVEAEAMLPDGRRVYGRASFTATAGLNQAANAFQSAPIQPSEDVIALYHFDADLADAAGPNPALSLAGNARLDAENLGWMAARNGRALHVSDLGDKAAVSIPFENLHAPGTSEITFEAMIFITSLKGFNRGNSRLLSLQNNWNASLELVEDAYSGPHLRGGTEFDLSGPPLAKLTLKQWHHLSLTISAQGYSARLDGEEIARVPSRDFANWSGGASLIEIGNFDGWIDELVIRKNRAAAAAIRPRIFQERGGLSITWSATAGKTYRVSAIPLFPSTGPKTALETVTALSSEGSCRIQPSTFRGFFVVEPLEEAGLNLP